MSEPITALKFLNSLLVPDSFIATHLLGGWHEVPPLGTQSPYGQVRNMTAAEDLTGLDGGVLIWSPVVMQIIVYERDRDNYSRLEPIANRIYAILQSADGMATGGIVYGCHRMNSLAGWDMDSKVVVRKIEQQYMLEARSE